jgi:hypothetical protein
MTSLDQRIYDGNRAKEVLENEAFITVFQDIEKELFTEWTNSPVRDQEGREKIFLSLKMLQKLHLTLQTSLETGKLAMMEVEHQRSLADRAKGIWQEFAR